MYEIKPKVQELLKKTMIINQIVNKALKNNDIELEIRMIKKYKETLMEIHLEMEEIILDEQGKDIAYLKWCDKAKKINDRLDLNMMLLGKQRERTVIYDRLTRIVVNI